MTWYEDAAWEIGDNATEWCAKYDEAAAAAIIAKHDPNRWIPVGESKPRGNMSRCIEVVNQKGTIVSIQACDLISSDRYWREIVLPEVKG